MPKFTVEDKLGAVNRYQLGIESINSIAKSVGTARSNLLNWIKQYETNGIEAFVKSYTSYTLEFKLDVLNYMNEKGTSSIEAAALFNIPSPGLIRKWSKIIETKGVDALKLKKKGRPSMKKKTKNTEPAEGSIEALQAENERLRMENAYLKKLNALVQEKEALQRKTKRK